MLNKNIIKPPSLKRKFNSDNHTTSNNDTSKKQKTVHFDEYTIQRPAFEFKRQKFEEKFKNDSFLRTKEFIDIFKYLKDHAIDNNPSYKAKYINKICSICKVNGIKFSMDEIKEFIEIVITDENSLTNQYIQKISRF